MRQLLFLRKEIYNEGTGQESNYKYRIQISHNILTDVYVPIHDVISPQKTTLVLPKTNKIELNDIVIVRKNSTGEIEYIGYVDTLVNKANTEVSCYPLINYFDNDFVLDQMFQPSTNEDGTNVDIAVDVIGWLTKQLTRAFVLAPDTVQEGYEYTEDIYQALPLIIRNKTKQVVLRKRIIDTSNLLEVYTDLFIETGVYIEFSGLEYNENLITGIYCDIYCNKDERRYAVRYDDPNIQSVDIVDNTFTNYNKLIATQELPEDAAAEQIANRQRYYFYLLNDNTVTRDPNDNRRIKQVRSKEITFPVEGDATPEENANALLQYVRNELQATEYNLQITVTMLRNNNLKLYRMIDFFAESGIIYTSNITKVEILNDKQAVVTLGALRNSLTDFKKKVETI